MESHYIIVLGCSKVLTKGDKTKYTPYSHAYGRLMKTSEVYNQIQSPNKMVICSGGFGQAHKMRNFLIENNVHPSDIFCEPYSKNTIENCIFSYELIGKWLVTKGEKIHIHLVTDDYHIKRSSIIFQYFSNRLPEYSSIYCYGSIFASYIESITENDIKEIGEAYINDQNIMDKFLNNSLSQYTNWYPIPQDYISRFK